MQVSQAGEQAVEAAFIGMQRVRAQMESIAQSVTKLGEHSQTIGDIITTVNDLAERSNLLAINAGIEAAKAGPVRIRILRRGPRDQEPSRPIEASDRSGSHHAQ